MPDISIVIGVFNENGNIKPLVNAISDAFEGVDWEIIYVDDASPDGTADTIIQLAQTNPRIRLIRRVGERGLASACVKGWLASTAPVLGVMDGDMQHDPRTLRKLYDMRAEQNLDLAVSSRFLDRAEDSGMRGRRAFMSDFGNSLARMVVKTPLTDPMSGLFVMTREWFDEAAPNLSPAGFKILLDLAASSPIPPKFDEVHAHLGTRGTGESKLDALVSAELIGLVVDKATSGLIPPRLALFLMVGGSGMVMHAGVLALSHKTFGVNFLAAQAVAMIMAMTSNYFLNNLFTFRDARREGMGLVWGLITFYLACSIGAVISLKSSDILYADFGMHWLIAGLGGAVLASLWNFVTSSVLTWRVGRKPARSYAKGRIKTADDKSSTHTKPAVA